MNTTSILQPKAVFDCFEAVCQVPHPSKREEKMIAFLEDFGKKLGLETLVDKTGNVLIKKPATPGMENRKTVVLQSHFDMVCEKNNDTIFDFDNDAIQTYVDGEWMKAKGTTLGADDGIGCAMRAGAALVIAGLSAEGVTKVGNIHFIERGYENLVEKFTELGATIRRLDD